MSAAAVVDPLAADLATELSKLRQAHERLRLAYQLTRNSYADLLAAARASVAAERDGEPDALYWLVDELEDHGQLPPAGAIPAQLAAEPLLSLPGGVAA